MPATPPESNKITKSALLSEIRDVVNETVERKLRVLTEANPPRKPARRPVVEAPVEEEEDEISYLRRQLAETNQRLKASQGQTTRFYEQSAPDDSVYQEARRSAPSRNVNKEDMEFVALKEFFMLATDDQYAAEKRKDLSDEEIYGESYEEKEKLLQEMSNRAFLRLAKSDVNRELVSKEEKLDRKLKSNMSADPASVANEGMPTRGFDVGSRRVCESHTITAPDNLSMARQYQRTAFNSIADHLRSDPEAPQQTRRPQQQAPQQRKSSSGARNARNKQDDIFG